MAEAISNIVSAGFKFLCKGELEEREAMEFTAKNILLNIHSVFKETMKEISSSELLKEKNSIEDIREHLMVQIDNILNNILVNLADSYPQAPIAG